MKRAVLACVLVACSAAPARTPTSAAALTHIAPDAQPLVEAWAAALGGRARLADAGAFHLRGAYTRGGVTGTIDLWQTPRGERREETHQAFLREVHVFDGKRGWLVDRNREVRALAGFELDEELALVFADTYAPIVTDRRPGEVTRVGDTLVLAPAGGRRTLTVTLDPTTHLPATTVRRDGEKLRTARLGDWRTVDGALLPFSIREDNGDPNDAVTIRVESIEHAAPPAGAFARPVDREPDARLPGPVTVPIEIAFGGLVFVHASINGTPLSFVLDTGAEATVLNSSRLARLGLTATGTFAAGAGGGDVVLSYVPHVTTQVGDATVTDQIVSAIPLDALEQPLGRPLDGILGYDFLSRFVVELDYTGKHLRLHDRATYHHPGAGAPLAITLEDSTPYIDASVEIPAHGPLPGHFVLDTGCLCEVQLSAPFTDDHRLLEAVPDAKQTGFSAGAGGETHQVSATIPALRVGPHVITKPQADFSRDTTGATADPENAGLIGSLVWKRFVLVLDYPHERVWLDPPSS